MPCATGPPGRMGLRPRRDAHSGKAVGRGASLAPRGDWMRRRDFMTMLGGAAALTLPARAQQPAVPVIGYLGSESPGPAASRLDAFRKGLAQAAMPRAAMSRSN